MTALLIALYVAIAVPMWIWMIRMALPGSSFTDFEERLFIGVGTMIVAMFWPLVLTAVALTKMVEGVQRWGQ